MSDAPTPPPDSAPRPHFPAPARRLDSPYRAALPTAPTPRHPPRAQTRVTRPVPLPIAPPPRSDAEVRKELALEDFEGGWDRRVTRFVGRGPAPIPLVSRWQLLALLVFVGRMIYFALHFRAHHP